MPPKRRTPPGARPPPKRARSLPPPGDAGLGAVLDHVWTDTIHYWARTSLGAEPRRAEVERYARRLREDPALDRAEWERCLAIFRDEFRSCFGVPLDRPEAWAMLHAQFDAYIKTLKQP